DRDAGTVEPAYFFFGGLIAYSAGAAAALVTSATPGIARLLTFGFALLGALFELCSCGLTLFPGVSPHWEISAGVPFLVYGFQLDALSTYFNLILSLLAAAVSIYSFGYLFEFENKRTLGVLGFFYNVRLL